jgi:hypothetical protein
MKLLLKIIAVGLLAMALYFRLVLHKPFQYYLFLVAGLIIFGCRAVLKAALGAK